MLGESFSLAVMECVCLKQATSACVHMSTQQREAPSAQPDASAGRLLAPTLG